VAVNATEASSIPPLEDLFLFRRNLPGDRPPTEAGAAMLALVQERQFPGFAMAFYEQLSAAGKDHPAPARLALLANDAILLAPSPSATGWRGFLIAEDTAADQVREFHLPGEEDPCCRLFVPAPESAAAVWAVEAAFLSTR